MIELGVKTSHHSGGRPQETQLEGLIPSRSDLWRGSSMVERQVYF